MSLCMVGCGIRAYFAYLEFKEEKKRLARLLKNSPLAGVFTFGVKSKT